MITVQEVDRAFRAFVGDPSFPCLAAKGTVRQKRYRVGLYGTLGSSDAAARLAPDLARFAAQPLPVSTGFTTFIAAFPDAPPTTEHEFEQRLWDQLQALHDVDIAVGWDPAVSADPDDAQFSFSFNGRAFFVVGLHQHSSRSARAFQLPVLAFNPQAQFARLRADGRFDRLRNAIRDREVALQGSLNPNLADFGDKSDARQYSGREVEADWRCPFHSRSV